VVHHVTETDHDALFGENEQFFHEGLQVNLAVRLEDDRVPLGGLDVEQDGAFEKVSHFAAAFFAGAARLRGARFTGAFFGVSPRSASRYRS
jgi:hypothetical protein